jgi:hypothetical protein
VARTIEQELKGLRQRLRQLEEKGGKVVDELIERGANPEPSGFARAQKFQISLGAAHALLIEHAKSGASEG